MSEEKSSPIGIIIIVVAAVIITGCASGKSAGENKQAKVQVPEKPTAPEKPAEPEEPAFIKEGLVAYYPFNGNAKDESGKRHDGEVRGATLAADRHGEDGKAYSFDGKDDYIEVKDADSLRPDHITLSLWIKTSETKIRTALMNKSERTLPPGGGGRFPNYVQFTMDPEAFHIKRESGGQSFPGWQRSGKAPTPIIGVWEHRIGVWDGKMVKFYVDGKLAASNAGLAGPMDNIPGGNIQIGTGWQINGGYWSGQMDDVRIYNRALSADEVKALYDFEKPKAE